MLSGEENAYEEHEIVLEFTRIRGQIQNTKDRISINVKEDIRKLEKMEKAIENLSSLINKLKGVTKC